MTREGTIDPTATQRTVEPTATHADRTSTTPPPDVDATVTHDSDPIAEEDDGSATDLSTVGEVLDASVSLGVNDGGNLVFGNDDPDKAISEAEKACAWWQWQKKKKMSICAAFPKQMRLGSHCTPT